MAWGEHKTDCELMSAAKFGNQDALGVIFARHKNQLLRTAEFELYSIKGRLQLAEDAVQRAFVKVLSLLGRASFWQPGKGTVIGWLKMIVRQQVSELTRGRSSSEQTCCDLESEGQACRSVEEFKSIPNNIGFDSEKMIDRLIRALPQEVGLVIGLTLEGFSNKEIAVRLGISLTTISRHCKLARRTIADQDFGLAA